MSTEETTPQRAPKPVATYWAEQVEKIRSLDQDGIRVVLWDAASAAQDHEHVAAGILHLPDSGFSLERLAYALRDTLQEVTGDPSISVTTCELDDDGAGDAEAWGRRGVAEFCEVSPYIADPWHDERDPEEDDDRAEYEAEDEELLNELAQLGAELVGHDDEDEEPEEDADTEPSDEEKAELMRDSLESTGRLDYFPSGTRFLPNHDQDQGEQA